MIDLTIVDFDELFESCPVTPIVANGMDIDSNEGKQRLNDLLLTRYNSGNLSNVPSCTCGHLHGMKDIGKTCEKCGDICETMLDRQVYPMVWVKAPEHAEYFINPSIWGPMSSIMGTSKCNDLEWLVCRNYKPPGGPSVKVLRMQKAGVKRGLKYFADNFEFVMREYLEAWHTRSYSEKKERFASLLEIFFKNKKLLFSKYLPMPSRTGLVVESNETGTYLDKNVPHAKNALLTIVRIDHSITPIGPGGVEDRVIKATKILTNFYSVYASDVLGGKPGIIRKNLVGSKANFTARAVITSLYGDHRYDELHAPWSLSMSLLRLHIANRLLKRGYNPKQIFKSLTYAARNYVDEFDRIFKELIELAGPKGIPVTFQRNPSLNRLSIQYFGITKVLTDPRIHSVKLSVLCIRGFNADFDGDEMNMYLPVTNDLKRRLSRLAPHNGLLSLDRPRAFSKDVDLPDACARLTTNFLLSCDAKRKAYHKD